MKAEGVVFKTGTYVGKGALPHGVGSDAKTKLDPEQVLAEFDAIVLAGGSEVPRDLPVPGRELEGVHFAMEFLPQQNKVNAGDKLKDQIKAGGKHVVVIGGGDTGSDCVGTSNRQGAKSVTQLELLPKPPVQEDKALTWPYWPNKLRTSSSHEEGCEREWSITTKEFRGENGKLKSLVTARVEWTKDEKTGQFKMSEVPRFRKGNPGRTRLPRDGLHAPGRFGARSLRRRKGRARQPPRHNRWRQGLHDQGRQGLRRRRHAPRTIAGGLGDPRRQASGQGCGCLPDGRIAAAALNSS